MEMFFLLGCGIAYLCLWKPGRRSDLLDWNSLVRCGIIAPTGALSEVGASGEGNLALVEEDEPWKH